MQEPKDREFFQRVWSTDPDIYKDRLKSIGFEGLDHVLDMPGVVLHNGPSRLRNLIIMLLGWSTMQIGF